MVRPCGGGNLVHRGLYTDNETKTMTHANPETIRTVEAGYRAGQAVDNPWISALVVVGMPVTGLPPYRSVIQESVIIRFPE